MRSHNNILNQPFRENFGRLMSNKRGFSTGGNQPKRGQKKREKLRRNKYLL